MIKIEHTDVHGFEQAIRGMRNPLNSWELSDSQPCLDGFGFEDCHGSPECQRADGDFSKPVYCIGPADFGLMQRLVAAGTDHSKLMRMIAVWADVTAPLYWWKEYDTYKVGTVANSCSTMHKIHAKEFTLEDFSCEHLIGTPEYLSFRDEDNESVYLNPVRALKEQIQCLNMYRLRFVKTKDKKWWWQMIETLPSSYNQRRTVMLNYAVLRNIYHARKNHKLDEWHDFCAWIEGLPYSELITMEVSVK